MWHSITTIAKKQNETTLFTQSGFVFVINANILEPYKIYYVQLMPYINGMWKINRFLVLS